MVVKNLLKVLQLCSFCSGEASKLALNMLTFIFRRGASPPCTPQQGRCPCTPPGPQRPLDPGQFSLKSILRSFTHDNAISHIK